MEPKCKLEQIIILIEHINVKRYDKKIENYYKIMKYSIFFIFCKKIFF